MFCCKGNSDHWMPDIYGNGRTWLHLLPPPPQHCPSQLLRLRKLQQPSRLHVHAPA